MTWIQWNFKMRTETVVNSRIFDIINDYDPGTALHSKRVSILSQSIGKEFGLSGRERTELSLAGLLHDIGKIAVPKSIILKPEALSNEEYDAVKTHAASGALIAEAAGYSEAIINVIRQHHERLDGSGYPERLSGEALDSFSKIVAVADVFVAMTADRPHRKALSENVALSELSDVRKYDPDVVKAVKVLLASPSGKKFKTVYY